jgi:hypothetical protein
MTDIDARNTKHNQLISQIPNTRAIADLRRMQNAVKAMQILLSQESVNCRRLKKTTIRYQEIHQKILDQQDNLEKHIMMARLMYG